MAPLEVASAVIAETARVDSTAGFLLLQFTSISYVFPISLLRFWRGKRARRNKVPCMCVFVWSERARARAIERERQRQRERDRERDRETETERAS